MLAAGAKKEIAYLEMFGQPLHPFKRMHREMHDYQKQSPLDHLESLKKYLHISSHLIPVNDESILKPTLRHPDLQPNNIFVSEDLSISGVIDWQHCSILPLFLQCGIPESLQNYGDDSSESLDFPELPCNFEELSDSQQSEQLEVFRRRQLHYFYVAMTAKLNPTHYDALANDFSLLRPKLFEHASYPWEGDNVTLKADLIHLTKNWSCTIGSNSNAETSAGVHCPISFSEDEISQSDRLSAAKMEADELLQTCRDRVGIGIEGWVPLNYYEEAKQREMKLKAFALDAAESEEERAEISEHWIFDDFDEDEYS